MKVGLFCSTQGNNNGPGKVVSNLVKGLELNGIEVLHNQLGEYNGCLQSWGTPMSQLSRNTLVGPNLCVIPTEMGWIWNRFENVVVPCQWVMNKYSNFECVKRGTAKLNIWAVGIDTDKFCPSEEKKQWDVLLYVKGRESQISTVKEYLENIGLRVAIVRYGNYKEEEFISLVRKSKSCVLLTKTESQGIAYQEILSMGVPCYVLDKDMWDDYEGFSFPATSVPYFDERCGEKHKSMDGFVSFYSKLDSFKPRQFIVESLSLIQSSKNYFSLLRGINDYR